MKYLTKNFGEIDVDESKIITFEEGIPGFAHCREFILLEELTEKEDDSEEGSEENDSLIWWLQSLDEGTVAFVLMNVFAVMPDYNPIINEEDIADLGTYNEEDFAVYNITVIPENITQLSVNLKAPIIINTIERKGKQVVVTNEEYDVRYRIFEELKKKSK